jgi:hypothetical protein
LQTLQSSVSSEVLKTPLISVKGEPSMPLSRQLSMLYPPTPTGGTVSFQPD